MRKRAIAMRPPIQAVLSVATALSDRWTTDLERVWTGKDGWASLALAIDFHVQACRGIHTRGVD